VYKRFSDKVPLLDPVKDMKINDKSFKKIVEKINTFETRLEAHPVHSKLDLGDILEAYKRKDCLLKDLEGAKSR
jgi:ATP-dependent RNA helicase DOB1